MATHSTDEQQQLVDTPQVKSKIPLAQIVREKNLAKRLSEHERGAFGSWVVGNYRRDLATRAEWEQRNQDGMKLALQVTEVKSFPWTNASNVKFPLVTIAALQFLARISILTKGRRIVKVEAIGKDPDGSKSQQCSRVSEHMSMQLTDDDVAWMDEDEKAKFAASIVGSAIKKSYFDPVAGVNISEYVPAQDFVVDYHCKHVETAPRATHLLSMSMNRVQERVRQGLFLEMAAQEPAGTAAVGPNLLQETADETAGTRDQMPSDQFPVLEQHCWFDFDHDGYAEPYIMWVRLDTAELLRIKPRFMDAGDVHRVNDLAMRQADNLAKQTEDLKVRSQYEKMAKSLETAGDNHVIRIDPEQYFTKYTFVPSPDGGWYGLGLGALLGPVNESVNTLINQLIDSGTMSNTAGGFLGRGVKLKGGKSTFDPFEWKAVDSTGDDLRKGIVPLPVKEPSAVLFQLLGMLTTYGEKIGSATDIMTGVSPGQNTPAETSRNTVEQGMMLFSGIYARMYRSFREELKKLYELNRLFLHASPFYKDLTEGANAILAPGDYTSNRFRIFPVADPSAVSGQQRKDKASKLVEFAMSPLGAKLDKDVIARKWLEANEYDDIELIFPDPKGPHAVQPPPNPKVALEQAKLDQQKQEHQDNMQLAIAEMKSQLQINDAKVQELEAKATMELANASGVETGHQIAMIEAQVGVERQKSDALRSALDVMLKAHEGRMAHGREMTKIAHDHAQAQQQQAAAAKPAATGGNNGNN